MNRSQIRAILKEITITTLFLFMLINTISYIRQPELASKQLPRIEVELVDGSSFKAMEKQPLLIHFWAINCPTCKMEAANIESVSKNYNVLTIAVNSGSNERIKSYMQKHALHFKVLNDKDGSWAEKFHIEVYPTTFIYDTKGRLQFTEVGYTTTAGLLARMALLEQ